MSPTESIQARAHRVLSDPNDGSALNDLLELLYESSEREDLIALFFEVGRSEDVRRAGLFLVAELGGRVSKGLEYARQAKGEKSPAIRARVVEIMGRFGVADSADLQFLAECLDAEEAGLVRVACRAILSLARENAVRSLSVSRRFRRVGVAESRATSSADQLVRALSLIVRGDLDAAALVGGQGVGGDLVRVAKRSGWNVHG